VRTFDRKFGDGFLPGVPAEPGVYRFYGPEGALLYVGKARNLRRRLAQYRTTGRRKKDRKRRALVRLAERITWEVCPSELDASLAEIRLIQSLRPPRNVAGAFPFLYPFIGIRADGRETHFCLTTSPETFPGFMFSPL
jgi:excinuclease ABC subunit C